MTNKTIGIIEKNRLQDVRVSLTEWRGQRLIDVRIFSVADTSDDRIPTKKGVALQLSALPALIEVLERAHSEAVATGILGD